MASSISSSQRTKPTDRAEQPPLKVCPACGRGRLIAANATETIVVDGRKRRIRGLRIWKCSECDESLMHGKEIRRATEEVRSRYSGQFRLRVGVHLHAKLARAAKEDHRSLNQEVVYVLEQGLKAIGKAQ